MICYLKKKDIKIFSLFELYVDIYMYILHVEGLN